MNTYEKFEAILSKTRKRKKKVAHNTVLYDYSPDEIGLKLHDTSVLIAHKNGNVRYSSGGWKTNTTKDRMNSYGPLNIHQIKGEWYFAMNGFMYPYHDCMVYNPTLGEATIGSARIRPVNGKDEIDSLRLRCIAKGLIEETNSSDILSE